MKAMKGKLLKKLKTIKTIGYLKPDRILQVNASDGFVPNSPPNKSNISLDNIDLLMDSSSVLEEPKKIPLILMSSVSVKKNCFQEEPEVIDVEELMKDLEDEEMEELLLDDENDDYQSEDKENSKPPCLVSAPNVKSSVILKEKQGILCQKKVKNESLEVKESKSPLGEINLLNFRRPDLDSDSGTLFDPNLLAAFEQAVSEVKAQEAERRSRIEITKDCKIIEEQEDEPPIKARKMEEKIITTPDPLLEFEEKCPPGGNDSVILYTTGLRGIRKTFEDCRNIRSLLDQFRILYLERDISMHSEYRDELWEILGGKIVPPRLFIKGRYIGGAEQVQGLLEQGKFKALLEGIPVDYLQVPCESCNGVRFIMCFNCNGSRKILSGNNNNGETINCPDCNENGLLICPLCC